MRKTARVTHRALPCLALSATVAAVLALAVALVTPPASASGASDGDKADQVARIAFLGDSIADNYWSGVTRLVSENECLKKHVLTGRYARNSTGLTRGDKLYWPREVQRVAANFKPTVMVVSLGLNDQQFIIDKNGRMTAWGAPNWSEKYRAEIVEFLTQASAGHAAVLLVGLPVMRSSQINNDVQIKNKWFADAVAELKKSNVQYIEPWRLKDGGPDTYSSYGRTPAGRMSEIRTSDGEHFTPAGEELVAAYLFPKIVAALDQMAVRLDACKVAGGK